MQQLKREQPSLLGIAISGYGADDDIQRSYQAGFIRHMTVCADLLKKLTFFTPLETYRAISTTECIVSSIEPLCINGRRSPI